MEDTFRAFVEAQWMPLVRTAYLIVGDRGRAEDLVQSALDRVHRNWRPGQHRDLVAAAPAGAGGATARPRRTRRRPVRPGRPAAAGGGRPAHPAAADAGRP